jgi:hypothetical protein
MTEDLPVVPSPPRWLVYLLIFGLYLTLRGYHSRDGDQAYRLPLLLHRQNPALYADDPFVRAFDAFNPHRGSLALLDAVSRPLGLSAGLLVFFSTTFFATCAGVDRLARAVWPEAGPRVGVLAIALVLTAKAGNIGTNHLFEAMLLDRLIALALGWLAIALVVEDPARGWWRSAPAIGAAALIHPSVGLQLALVLAVTWFVWCAAEARTGVSGGLAARAVGALGLALVPGLAMILGEGARLLAGLSPDEFRLLSVELQGPQHMLPHLWRLPQWLAWGCYPTLALLTFAVPTGARGSRRASEAFAARQEPRPADDPSLASWCVNARRASRPAARTRLALMLAVNLAALVLAWLGVEVLQDLRITLFQPFRMATLARGVALIALSGRILALWRGGGYFERPRAALLTVGLVGDWSLVVVTLIEVVVTAVKAVEVPRLQMQANGVTAALAGAAILVAGLRFLVRHDTESGHVSLLAALAATLVWCSVPSRVSAGWTRRRIAWAFVLAWLVPAAALVLEGAPLSESFRSTSWVRSLVERCRFLAVPADDVERLAAWCREHTPESARFIGPPGPKTFRLWSRRSLAFNRAGSPYHAAGLADWSARFRDHVGFRGSTEAFVRVYLADRHSFERRYETMSDAERATLAVRQGATHVVAAAPPAGMETRLEGPLELLHVEGRYAVYRLRAPPTVARHDSRSGIR